MKKYHTHRKVYRIISTDGSMAAMAGFSICALADGKVTAQGNNKFVIKVSSLSVFAMNRFNFPTEDKFLGYWSCEKKRVSLGHADDTEITDGSFNAFSEKFGKGGDFLALSNLHKVEKFTRLEYVYDDKEKHD